MNKELLKYISVPLILMLMYLIFISLYSFFGLPSDEEIIASAGEYYEKYGYWTVFIGALGEGLLLLNWYLPGSIVVVLGVIFAKEAGLSVVGMIALVVAGFFITTLINYVLGRFGWYKLLLKIGLEKPLDNIKAKTEKVGPKIIFSTYIHPNLGALTATSAGILKFPFVRFSLYSLAALVLWNTMWGILVYFIGPFILKLLSTVMVVLILIIWTGFLVYRHHKVKTDTIINIP